MLWKVHSKLNESDFEKCFLDTLFFLHYKNVHILEHKTLFDKNSFSKS